MFSINDRAILGSAMAAPRHSVTAGIMTGGSSMRGSGQFTTGGTAILPDFSYHILDGFINYQSQTELYKIFREIYTMDAITGPCIDQLASLPWSTYTLLGITDPKIHQMYSDCLSELNLIRLMTYISTTYLVLGNVICSLVFDKDRGIFSDCILFNPDDCEMIPIPMIGYDPKVNVKISKDVIAFLNSQDIRDLEAKKELSIELQQSLKSGKSVQLEPLNTIIISRTPVPGIQNMSYLSRILPIWIVEKALSRGTIISSAERQRGILQIQCLKGDTLVDVNGKLKKIGDISKSRKIGKSVPVDFTTIGTYGKRVNVKNWIYQGKKPIYQLSTKSGFTLNATGNHLVATLDNKATIIWKKVEDITCEDYLLIDSLSNNASTKKEEFKIEYPNWKKSPKKITTPHYMNEKLAYLLGMIISDGTIRKYSVYISNTNYELLKECSVLIKDIFGIKSNIRVIHDRRIDEIEGRKISSNKLYNLEINNTMLVEFLNQIGVFCNEKLNPNKKQTKLSTLKRIPYSIFEADLESKYAFIAGYIDGDGCITTHKNALVIDIISYSKGILKDFQRLFSHMGIKSMIRDRRISISYTIANNVYRNIFPYLKHSKKKFDYSDNREKNQYLGIPTKYFYPSLLEKCQGQTSKRQYIFETLNGKIKILQSWGVNSDKIYKRKYLTYDSYDSGRYDGLLECIKTIDINIYNNLMKLLKYRYIIEPVVNIKRSKKEFEVFDLSIDTSTGDDPAFIANGLLVHNCGGDEYEYTQAQMDGIAELFANAARDPQGAIVVTRPDVNTTEVMSPQDFWNVSNERDSFTNLKLRALGLSESFGSDSTYNNADNSMTMFMEMLRNHREHLVKSVIYDKIFLLLAKYHGFKRRTKAELAHNVRYDDTSHHAASRISSKRTPLMASRNMAEAGSFIIPEIKWTKELSPKGDSNALSMLDTAKNLGLSLPVSLICTAAGIPLHTYLDALNDDLEARKKIKHYNDELKKIDPQAAGGGQDSGGGVFGKVNEPLLAKLTHTPINTPMTLSQIKDKTTLLQYLYNNIPPEVRVTSSQARNIISQINSVKRGLVKL